MVEISLASFVKMISKSSKHILELSAVEQKNFIDSFDVVLSDCDGVIWMVVSAIPNTGPALKLLMSTGKQCKYVSNNSFRTDEEYLKKFKAIGLDNVQADDIVTPPKTMISYLKKYKAGEKVFSLCSNEGNDLLLANGIDVETVQKPSHWTPTSLVKEIRVDHKVAAVLFDINLDLSYVELAKAHQYLLQEECVLLAGGNDKHFPLDQGLTPAGFFDFLQHLSNYSQKEPILLGKPSPTLGQMLKAMFQITESKRCLFIGDSLQQDIEFGNFCGFQTLLVLTGVATKEQMLQARGTSACPDYYAAGLADFIELFANLEQHSL